MASMRIKKDDMVKIISGSHKGEVVKVIATNPTDRTVILDGIGVIKRKVKPTQMNPRGGNREIHKAFDVSNVVLVSGEKQQPTRVNFEVKADGTKVRRATALKNKEIK